MCEQHTTCPRKSLSHLWYMLMLTCFFVDLLNSTSLLAIGLPHSFHYSLSFKLHNFHSSCTHFSSSLQLSYSFQLSNSQPPWTLLSMSQHNSSYTQFCFLGFVSKVINLKHLNWISYKADFKLNSYMRKSLSTLVFFFPCNGSFKQFPLFTFI